MKHNFFHNDFEDVTYFLLSSSVAVENLFQSPIAEKETAPDSA